MNEIEELGVQVMLLRVAVALAAIDKHGMKGAWEQQSQQWIGEAGDVLKGAICDQRETVH